MSVDSLLMSVDKMLSFQNWRELTQIKKNQNYHSRLLHNWALKQVSVDTENSSQHLPLKSVYISLDVAEEIAKSNLIAEKCYFVVILRFLHVF